MDVRWGLEDPESGGARPREARMRQKNPQSAPPVRDPGPEDVLRYGGALPRFVMMMVFDDDDVYYNNC